MLWIKFDPHRLNEYVLLKWADGDRVEEKHIRSVLQNTLLEKEMLPKLNVFCFTLETILFIRYFKSIFGPKLARNYVSKTVKKNNNSSFCLGLDKIQMDVEKVIYMKGAQPASFCLGDTQSLSILSPSKLQGCWIVLFSITFRRRKLLNAHKVFWEYNSRNSDDNTQSCSQHDKRCQVEKVWLKELLNQLSSSIV